MSLVPIVLQFHQISSLLFIYYFHSPALSYSLHLLFPFTSHFAQNKGGI